MRVIPDPGNKGQTALMNDRGQVYVPAVSMADHETRIRRQLRELGMSKIAMLRSEIKYLPRIIHLDEQVGGVAYGSYEGGFAVLVATDKRVIFLDKKPMATIEDEITYFVVSGVSLSSAGINSTVSLHTRIKDYTLQTLNEKCAEGFVRYIEARCIEHNIEKEVKYDYNNPDRVL